MSEPPFEVLFEDNHCLAIRKEAGRLSAHYAGTEEPLDREARAYLKAKYHKPGNVFLGVVHRLDRPVSGVLLFARTSKAAARLSEQFREGTIEKVYWAVVEGDWSEPAGSLVDWLRKNDEAARVEVVSESTPGARQAVLHYTRKARHQGLTWLEIRPQTGRTHQLRVQLATRGFPIFADAKYGGLSTFGPAIGLHARSLTFLHPTRMEPITVVAEVPRTWRGRFAHLLHGTQT